MRKTISHYKLVKELGRGAMATVYKAVDLESQKKPLALKVLLPHLSSDPVIHKRFLREAKAGMELNHPSIVKVYEVGEEEKQSFIAMELVKGKTLYEMVKKEALDIERVIDIGRQVADALAAAHERGIIHRDIKPKNIMVSNGSVKVMDFGLARIRDTSTLTDKHEIVGTLCYMSPQQAIGAQIDAQSDIFSLGIVLYQLLTGILPFEGDHPGAIIHAILHSDPLRMEEIKKGIPVEVEQVIFKALRKKPRNRYQTALELKSDLEKTREILKGKSVTLIATEEVFEERARGIYSALVGRERELKVLEGHLEKMLKSEGSTLLVRGEAGIGKSRLVWELGKKAKEKKVRYLIGRCIFGREGFPYQPILEVIRSYLELKGVRDPERLGDFIEDKAPNLTDRMAVIMTILLMRTEKEPSLINKEQLWDTATELVKVMAQDRPILLHLDDLHLADLPTLNLLNYLSRNTQTERVLIVGTYRPEELEEKPKPHPLLSVLERMGKEGLYEEISLARLDKKGTQSVINSVFPESDFSKNFIALIYEEAEGNPLFILEVLALLRNQKVISKEDGVWRLNSEVDKVGIPDRVSEVITHRLKTLTEEEKTLMDVASVQGLAFQSDMLCYCLRLPRMKVLLRLQNLEHSHHLIHASDREYHFDHSMIRKVVYDNLIPELKREYHRFIGDYLKKNFGKEEEYAGKIAHHFIEAYEEKEALPYLIKAGEHAKNLFANEEAVGYFNKGIELVDKWFKQHPTSVLKRTKITLLKARAEVIGLIGCIDEAQENYESIEQLACGLGDQSERAYGLNGIGETMWKRGNYEKALCYYEQALKIRRQIGNKLDEGTTLRNIGVVHYSRGDYDKALRYFEHSLKIRRQIGDKQGEGAALSNIGGIHYHRGDYEQALSYFEQASTIHRQIGDKRGEGATLGNIGNTHWQRGDYELALSYLEQALRIGRQIGDKRREAYILNNIGLPHWNRGDYERALSHFEQALRIHRQIGDRRTEGLSLNNIGAIHLCRGDYGAALSYFEQALRIGRQIGEKRGEGMALNNIGAVHRRRGDYEVAFSYLKQALKIMKQIREKWVEAMTLIDIGTIYQHRGDYGLARNSLEQALKIMKQTGGKEGQWQSHHCLGKLWLDLGDIKKSQEELEKGGQIAKAIGTKKISAWYHIDGALVKFLKGSYEYAHLDIQKGLDIAKKLKEIDAIIEGLVVTFRIEIARRNNLKARQHAAEVLSLATEKERKRDVAQASLLLAYIHLSKGDLAEAVSHATQAKKIAEVSGMKELAWQALYWLGKIHLKRKKYTIAQKELVKAEKLVKNISLNLNKELRKTYLSKTEIRELYKDLRIIKARFKQRRKS